MYIENFSYELPGERILKIGPDLPKLSKIKGLGFFGTVYLIVTRYKSFVPQSGL